MNICSSAEKCDKICQHKVPHDDIYAVENCKDKRFNVCLCNCIFNFGRCISYNQPDFIKKDEFSS